MHFGKKLNLKVLSLLMVLTMVISVAPVASASAAPTDLTRAAVYTFAEGNIARHSEVIQSIPTGSSATNINRTYNANGGTVGITASYSSTANAANDRFFPSMNNGYLVGQSASGQINAGYNSYGFNSGPVYAVLRWTDTYVVDSTRVMWWYDGTSSSSGVTLPSAGSGTPTTTSTSRTTIQFWNATNARWENVTNLRDASNASVSNIGVAGSGTGGTNRTWNAVKFDPVSTDRVRLVIQKGVGNGVGVGEWEVFGLKSDVQSDLAWFESNYVLTNLKSNVTLPATGPMGSAFSYVSSDTAVFGNDGTVTRPAIGQADATGTLTVTASKAGETASKALNWSVTSYKSDAEIVDHDLGWINIGSTTNRTTNFTLPAKGEWESEITWSAGGSQYLWDNGSVIRPSSGSPDATVTLTATATYGSVTKTREWTVTIQALVGARYITAIETTLDINTPQGMAAKLPYQVKVRYNDGSSEFRTVRWPYSASTESTQANYAVGYKYSVTGNIVGDISATNGYAITANLTVVTPPAVPTNVWDADAIPLNNVQINGTNRLTNNRSLAVARIAGLDVTQYIYNYRDSVGLSTSGYTSPSGWDNTTTKLKGHGTGHYMSALAFAYNSNPTTTQKATLLANMNRMVDEIRECQERTFVKNGSGEWIEARDYFDDSRLQTAQGTWTAFNAYKTEYEQEGYGYVNCIPAAHPILLENYRGYDNTNWLWAPYYSIHKQLAGLIDIYQYTGNEKALLVAKDMGLWIWNRLKFRTYLGASGDRSKRGNRYDMWNIYIAGEYGGMNESMARLADLLKAKEGQPGWESIYNKYNGNGTIGGAPITTDWQRLLEGATFFDNTAFFDPLAKNTDSIRTRHANQHIPQIVGSVWTYRGTGDAKYYNIAENFWNMVQNRYRYSPGGVGNGEMFREPYAQMANIGAEINETCCAYNLAKLSKDMALLSPDDAKYMDYYERILYNQLVGSIGSTYSVTYQYAVGSDAAKPYGNNTPSSTCCGGTGAENHVKYQEATYFTNNNTIWVNLYMPTTAYWAAKDLTITQASPSNAWPAQSATITLNKAANFTMKLRVPSWATKGFDIKVNNVSVQPSYTPSSYVAITRNWLATDTVTITMPFTKSIDYAPDKLSSQWQGTLMYGPLAMVSSGATSTLTLDSYYSDITTDVSGSGNTYKPALTAAGKSFSPDFFNTSGNFTHYYSINIIGDSAALLKTPLFEALNYAKFFLTSNYTAASLSALNTAITNALSVYQSSTSNATQITNQVTALNNAINSLESAKTAGENISGNSDIAIKAKAATTDNGVYSVEFAALANNAVTGQIIIAAFKNGALTKIQTEPISLLANNIETIKSSMAYDSSLDYKFFIFDSDYIPMAKINLANLLNTNWTIKLADAYALAVAKPESDYTRDSFAAFKTELINAKDILSGPGTTLVTADKQAWSLLSAMKALVLTADVNKAALDGALDNAANPEYAQEKYTVKSWARFTAAIAKARAVYEDQVASQHEVDDATEALIAATSSLHPAHLCDDYADLEALIASAQALNPANYSAGWAELQDAIAFAIMTRDYCRDGSGTWDMKDNAILQLQTAINNLVAI